MTPPLFNHPQSPTNPDEGEMRLVLECFNQWLDQNGTKTQKAHRILEALAKESLKLAESKRSARQFEVEYLTDAMGEFPWRYSKDRSEWIAWNKTVLPYLSAREASLIAFARAKGLKKYPYPVKHATAGGPGNKATYEIVALDIKYLRSEPSHYSDGTILMSDSPGKEQVPTLHNLPIASHHRYSVVLSVVLALFLALAFVKNPQFLSANALADRPELNSSIAPLSQQKNDQGFVCSTKKTCKEMASCAEAQYYLKTCGVKSLDRDHDGIACENLCR
jgi:hypothetical protein